jgi:hypothetical protein
MLLLLGVLAGATGGIGSILLYENAATIKAKIAGAGDSLLPRQNQADSAPAFLLAEDGTTAQENHAAADAEDSTAVTASVTAAEPPAPAAADAPPAPEPPAPLAADISPAPAPEPQPEPQPEKTPDPAVIQKMASLINTIRTKLPVLPSLEALPQDSAALVPAPAPAPPAADAPVAAADSPVATADSPVATADSPVVAADTTLVSADPGSSVADTAIDSDFYVQRGNDMLDLGDVASARLFYQAGAKAGAINCLTAIGLTYDPLALEQRGLTAIYADSKLAIQWYEKAIQAGDQQASERLSKLRTWLADVAAITAPAAPSRY